MKIEFSRHIFETPSNIKFHENPSSVSRVFPCGRKDSHVANSRFSQFCERPKKWIVSLFSKLLLDTSAIFIKLELIMKSENRSAKSDTFATTINARLASKKNVFCLVSKAKSKLKQLHTVLNKFFYLTNENTTWCHLLFYFTYYALNMFRTLIYPSSGACDCVDELPHRSSCSQFVVC